MLLCTVCSIWGHIELGKVEIREWLEAILRILELIYGKGEFGGKHTIFFEEELDWKVVFTWSLNVKAQVKETIKVYIL